MSDDRRIPDDVARASMACRGIPTPAGWLGLGLCPEPRTAGQTFRYHVGHGLLMQYTLVSILRFAWRNRRSFGAPQRKAQR